MQEAPPAPTKPAGFLNRLVYLSMVISTIGGAVFCMIVHALCWQEISRSRIRFSSDAVSSYYERGRTLDGPGKPWLCFSAIILLAAFLTYLPRIYLVFRRRHSVISSTKLAAQLTASGGLCFFAGAETYYGTFFMGILLMAYAGVGYLAYTRWERVRSQLYNN